MNERVQHILDAVTDGADNYSGAHNVRVNGQAAARKSTATIRIESKTDKSGIDVFVAPGTKNELVHIPVVIDSSGLQDLVYNDFFIGADSDVVIVAGCGIHNDGHHLTQHDGIHTFHVGENARVKYVEKHYGEGEGRADRVINPETVVHLASGAHMEMESVQIEGIDSTKRVTRADLADDATFITKEIILTSGQQTATTDFHIELNGQNSSTNLVSRSVAKGDSKQYFYSVINGNNACKGHSACDAILMDRAMVKAVPDVTASHVDAALLHEAAIGRIAGDQIMKLMTLGLSEEEAEEEIVKAFLR